ncbi:uncharacterized protein G2W53_009157 [Senna tora]|uniref:Uncharacterized protein n=1 Tax=Senna tora TaxID=362788 RepID=A0A834WYH9_9FABA|nr:uncharacterized protein G2W53_009157 [Senna tora]
MGAREGKNIGATENDTRVSDRLSRVC